MLSGKQGGIKYHFLSLWYDWTQVSRAIGEHFNHYDNVRYRILVRQKSVLNAKPNYITKKTLRAAQRG